MVARLPQMLKSMFFITIDSAVYQNCTFLFLKRIANMKFDKKNTTYISNTGQLLTLKPNGTVYTKTGGDNFVNLSCGFPFNPKFGNDSRTPISECLWTRTIQFESGKNFSEKFFCKVRIFSYTEHCEHFRFQKRKYIFKMKCSNLY